jgi:hypothetical protein
LEELVIFWSRGHGLIVIISAITPGSGSAAADFPSGNSNPTPQLDDIPYLHGEDSYLGGCF